MVYLKGQKTYIVAVLVALTVVAQQLGWIDDPTSGAILGLLGAGGLATLRAGVRK